VFLPEEIPERYNKNQRTCVRCLVADKQRKSELVLPSCYGTKYDSLEESCVRHCALKHACIIETVDTLSHKWIFNRIHLVCRSGRRRRSFCHSHHIVRLLRVAGRPMHLDDIAPIIAYNNGGAEEFKKNRNMWKVSILKSLEQCSDVVRIGGNFFIWAGIWDLKNGGDIRPYNKLRPEERLLSLEEIFKDL
jgi:hypothetical protein